MKWIPPSLCALLLTSGCAVMRGPGSRLRAPASPNPLIVIETPNLPHNAQAEYCTRDEEIVDTVVFHHTAGSPFDTVEEINEVKIEATRDTADPWYMLGYHFTIRGPYENGAIRAPRTVTVSQGRPYNLVGAHVGARSYGPVSAGTRALLRGTEAVLCDQGRERPSDVFSGSNAKSQYHTIGVAIIGQYVPRSRLEPTGYVGSTRRLSSSVKDAAARMLCELKSRYPRLSKVAVHRNFGQTAQGWDRTSCPGIHIMQEAVPDIVRRAAAIGQSRGIPCVFE